MNDNGHELEAGEEQRMIACTAMTAVLLLRVGRDGSVILSGDVITAGDDVRAYGLLERLKQAIGPVCDQARAAAAQRIVPPPPGLRLS
jgi:hypothetical protein